MKGNKITNAKYWLIGFLMMGTISVGVVKAVTPEPGSDANPLVTLDYVDAKVNELNTKISTLTTQNKDLTAKVTELTAKNDELTGKLTTSASTVSDLGKKLEDISTQLNEGSKYFKFIPLELKAGQKLLLGESTEVIVRSGKTTALTGTSGGISDLTSGLGSDLKPGAAVPLNHILLASRNDGRGLRATTGAWIIIKGPYTLN